MQSYVATKAVPWRELFLSSSFKHTFPWEVKQTENIAQMQGIEQTNEMSSSRTCIFW